MNWTVVEIGQEDKHVDIPWDEEDSKLVHHASHRTVGHRLYFLIHLHSPSEKLNKLLFRYLCWGEVEVLKRADEQPCKLYGRRFAATWRADKQGIKVRIELSMLDL